MAGEFQNPAGMYSVYLLGQFSTCVRGYFGSNLSTQYLHGEGF
jgi:hypothetical protein